jgi:hypothetical protein
MKASVEGGVLARGVSDSSKLARTKIHSVALTFTPANNATLVEPIHLNKSAVNWEADRQLIKSVMHLAETNIPSFRHIQRHASANTIHENINKIQQLAKHLGIEVEVKIPNPETIMKNAVFYKIENNVKKINQIVKELNKAKIDFMAMTPKASKLMTSPSTTTGFAHPDFINKLGTTRLADDHPQRTNVAKYVNDLKNTPHPLGGNINHNEAERLYNALLKSDLSKAPKKYGFDEKEPNVPSIKVKKKIKNNLIKAFEYELDKSLTAGFGGSGMPTDLSGGGVIQAQSLQTKRKKKLKNKLIKNFLQLNKSEKLYHGTSHPFKSFGATPPGKVKSGEVNALGPGHYFTTDKEHAADNYGKYVAETQAELTNPALSHEDVDSSKIKKYIHSIKDSNPEHAKILSNYIDFKDNHKDYVNYKPSTAKAHQFIDPDVSYKKMDSTLKSLIDNQGLLSESYNAMLGKFGHDGIIHTGGGYSGGPGETVFFNSKNIGPVNWHKQKEEDGSFEPLKNEDSDIYDPDYAHLMESGGIKKSMSFQKSIEYITCDNCGHEQVFMPHQVKCRDCRSNFSLYRLNSKK